MSTENQDPKDEEQTKTYSEEEFKKVVAQRDAVKAEKLAIQAEKDKLEAEKKALGEDDLKKKGEIQTLLDSRDKELAEIKKNLDTAKEYETKYTDLDKSIRQELLEELPEELREVAEDLSTAKLKTFVKLNSSKTPGTETTRPGGKTKIILTGKKYDDFSSKDLDLIKKSDPDGYAAMFKERFGIMPG
mgnify:CR=1 FL=1